MRSQRAWPLTAFGGFGLSLSCGPFQEKAPREHRSLVLNVNLRPAHQPHVVPHPSSPLQVVKGFVTTDEYGNLVIDRSTKQPQIGIEGVQLGHKREKSRWLALCLQDP